MRRVNLCDSVDVSQVIHGHWRMMDWGYSTKQLEFFLKEIIDLGVTTFDHADIYGNHECESKFGKFLKTNPEIRANIQIITKCGIKLLSNKYPERKVKHYDYSKESIIASVENSLRNFNSDYIDVLLLHRPSPLLDPREVAEVLDTLYQSGKVLCFGVSNFTPIQIDTLQKHLNAPIVTNQIEISPLQLQHFDNGNLDFCIEKNIIPMAWSPLAGGEIFNAKNKVSARVLNAVNDIARELAKASPDEIIYSWLFKHPSNIIPIVGTQRVE